MIYRTTSMTLIIGLTYPMELIVMEIKVKGFSVIVHLKDTSARANLMTFINPEFWGINATIIMDGIVMETGLTAKITGAKNMKVYFIS